MQRLDAAPEWQLSDIRWSYEFGKTACTGVVNVLVRVAGLCGRLPADESDERPCQSDRCDGRPARTAKPVNCAESFLISAKPHSARPFGMVACHNRQHIFHSGFDDAY